MSSRTGSAIALSDAKDLLHKLITESTKVQSVFRSSIGLIAAVVGVAAVAPNGWICVAAQQGPPSPLIMFDFGWVVSAGYGDNRAFPGNTFEGGPILSSILHRWF